MDEENLEEGTENGVTDDKDTQTGQDEFVESEDSIQDGQGEDSETEEGSELPREEGGKETQIDPRDYQKLKEDNIRLQTRVESIEKVFGEQQNRKSPEWTEENYAALGERTNLSRDAIDFILRASMKVADQIKQDNENRYMAFERENAINEMSRKEEFLDIHKYKQGMEEFLKKFEPKHHSNKEVLEMAFYAAKGRSSEKMVRDAMKSKDKNRRIAGNARPSSSTGGNNKGGSVKLAPHEVEMAEASGISLEEYAKYKTS